MARAAEKQFWGCPELVEGLLPFMDTLSIRRLVQVVMISALVMLIMVIFMEPLTEAWPSLLQSWQSCNIHYHQNDHIMAMVTGQDQYLYGRIHLHAHNHIPHGAGTPAHPEHCLGQDHVEEADQEGLL